MNPLKVGRRSLSLLLLWIGLAATPALAVDPPPAVSFDLQPELISQAVFSCQAMSITGSARVESQGVTGGTSHGNEGHIRSNAGITLSGTVDIFGDAMAGPGFAVTRSGNVQVSGTVGSASAPLRCVPIDLAALQTQLATANNNAAIPLTDKGRQALGGADGKTFSLNGRDGVTLPAGSYLFSSLTLSGNSTIRLDGRVNILVTGAINITGGGVFRHIGNVFQLRLFTRGNFSVSSQALVQGFVYAPSGTLSMTGGAEIHGTAFAKTVTIAGGAKVRRIVDDGPPVLTIGSPTEGEVLSGCGVTVSGTAFDQETGLTVKVNGSPATYDPVSGAYSATITLGGADPGLIVVEATDAGNITSQLIRRVSIAEPVLTLTRPVAGLIGSAVVDLGGGSGNATAVTIDGVPATLSGGGWSIEDFNLGSDGIKTLAGVATYCLGSTSATFVFDVDTAAPAIAIEAPLSGDLFASTPVLVTGTVADAHLTTVSVNGVVATVDNGRFSATVPLVDGNNTLRAVAGDELGRSSESSVVVELDRTAPEVLITVPTSGAIVGTTPILVSGTFDDPNIAAIAVNDRPATLAGGGFSLSLALDESDNSLVATARDRAGNESSSPTVVVVLDSLPPELTLATAELPALTSAASLTVVGTVADPHLEAVSVSGIPAVVAGSSYSAEIPLQEGANSLAALATDVLDASLPGHRSQTAAFVVVRDSLPPVLTVQAPSAGAVLTSRTVVVEGTVVDAHLRQVTINGELATVTDESFRLVLELSEGAQTLSVRAVDSLDQETVTEIAVVIDTLPPALQVESPLDGALATSVNVFVGGSLVEPHLESLTINGQVVEVSEGRFEAIVELLNGTTLELVAIDAYGHERRITLTLRRDDLPPGVAIDAPALGEACLPADTAFTVGGSFADPEPSSGQNGAPPALQLNVQPTSGAAVSHVGVLSADRSRWQVSGVLPGSADGLVQLEAVATDALGNSARAIAALRVDAAPPTLTLLEGGSPLPGQGAGATPPPAAPATLYGRPVALTAVVADGAGSAPPQATMTLDGAPYQPGTLIGAAGRHVVVARVNDCAGRVVERWGVIEIDRTAPQLLSSTPAEGASLQQGPAAFSGTADADLLKATVNGLAAAITGPGSFSLSPFAWREGENVVDIVLEDRAGNRASYRRSFTVHSLPLTVEIRESGLNIGPNQLFLRPVVPRASASTSGASIVLTLNGGPFQNGSTIAAAGSYTLIATATEGPRTATASATFRIELSPAPTVTITTPLDGTRVSGAAIDVAGSATGDGVTVTVNGLPAILTGNSWNRAAVPLADQEIVQLEAVATDRFGRRASQSVGVLRQDGMTLLILDPAPGTTTNRDRIDVVGVVVGGRGESLDGKALVGGPAAPPVEVLLAPDGSFRARDVALAAGDNQLFAEVKDRFGATRRATVAIRADFRPPQIAVSANGNPLLEGAIFGGELDLAITITDDSGRLAATSLRLNGQEQTATGSPIALRLSDDGGYLLGITARDAAGNEARAERSFVIDRGGCALSEIEPANNENVDSAVVSLRGRSGDAVVVEVIVPGQATPYAAQVADGTFLLGGLALPQVGNNDLQIRCRDAGGQIQTVSHRIVVLPAGSGPQVVITSPADGAVVDLAAVSVDGTSSVPKVSVNGASVGVVGGNLWSKPALPLAIGPNIVVAQAVDGSGRVATDRVVVHRDNQAPKVTITAPDNGARVGIAGNLPAAVDVSGQIDLTSEPHLASVVVLSGNQSVTASVDASGRFLALAVPLDGTVAADLAQTLTVRASDSLGHQGSATVDVYLDKTGPAIVLTVPADLTYYRAGQAGPIEVRGRAWAIDGARITINGSQLDPAGLSWQPAGADGRREVEFVTSVVMPDRDGPFGIQARVIDPQEKSAQDRRLLVRDFKAPLAVELIPGAATVGVDPDSLLFALFDEPVVKASLAGEAGLRLTRVSTGEVIAGSYTLAGSAVGFAPAASLERGEDYVWQAGLGIVDLAGNGLSAAKSASFKVAALASAAAPSLDPPPALICADRLILTGQASPGALVKVRDGSLLLATYADPSGRFRLELPISSNGFHLLHVFAVDAESGISSPETSAVVQVDCSKPQVRDASFDRASGLVTITFSEKIAEDSLAIGQAGNAIEIKDAEDPAAVAQSGSLQVLDQVVRLQLDTAQLAWWRERPVRLTVGPPAADLEGNVMANRYETVFFPGSSSGLAGGFLFGESYDDATGRPLGGVTVSLFPSSALLPGSVAAEAAAAPQLVVSSEGRGRFTLAGEVAPGRYSLLLEKAGYTRVVRRMSLEPAKGAVPFDSRLTPLAAPIGENLDPAQGGRREFAGYAFTAAAGVLPGAESLALRLTPLSAQGLPDFLPLGFTPAAAVELRLETAEPGLPAASLPEDAFFLAGAVAELPLPSWVLASDDLVAVQYELATGRWLVLPEPQRSGQTALVEPRGPGVVAVVVADSEPQVAPPAAIVGAALLGSAAPETTPGFTAALSLDPPVVPPTGRSLARVIARSADGATAWPSGLAVQAFLEERLVLAGGLGQELEAPFSVDLLLYHPRLGPDELDGAAAAAVGELRFVVSPSPRAAQVLLDVGWENIRIYPFPEETERGQVVGPTGGTVGDPQAVELTIPEGALSSDTVATVELLDAAELAELPPVAGYSTLAAVRLSLQGRELGRPATLRMVAPANAPAEVVGDPRLVLGFLIEEPGDYRGSLVRLAARAREQGSGDGRRLLAGPDSDGGLPLDGIVQEGLYLMLRAEAPIGFATGLVTYEGGVPLELARVVAEGLGTADSARQTGRYILPVPAGAGRIVRAFHPQTDERGEGQVELAAGGEAALNLQVRRQPPTIVQVTPADGAVNVAPNTAIAITFSEPLAASSISAGTLQLELAGEGGRGSGVFAEGEARLTATGETLQFLPVRPLLPGRTWIARFSGGVADLQGTPYAGPAKAWSFSTGAVVLPGSIDPTRFHVRIPENGVAAIFADPGALPGTGGWAVSPYVVGPWRGRDPVRNPYQVAANGSFQGTVGRLPSYPVTIESEVWVVVIGPSNQVEAEFRVGPFTSADGKGFVAPPGEAFTFRSAEGVLVDVPAAAFDKATLVRIEMLDPSQVGVATPAGMGIGAYVNVDFEGRAKETLRVHVPAPAAVASDSDVFIANVRTLPWGKRLQMLSYGGVLERGGERFLSNAAELQAEPDRSALPGLAVLGEASNVQLGELEAVALREGDAPQTCREVKERGVGRCFANALLWEFEVRSLAVFLFESGVDFALITGGAGFLPYAMGVAEEAFINKIADLLVYLPRPIDSAGGFWVLPIAVDSPFVIQRRDAATGWVISEKAYDPVAPGGPPIMTVDPVGGLPPQRPMLIGAKPFELLRFGAPPVDEKTRLRLEIEIETNFNEQLVLRSVDDFPLPDHSTIGLWDLAPLRPKDKDHLPEQPIRGPEAHVCDASGVGLTLEASDDMLAVLMPGDLEKGDVEFFEFLFDRALHDLSKLPEDQVAILKDLGPIEEGCNSSQREGYPKKLAVQINQAENGQRLLIAPLDTLPMGHRFELQLIAASLESMGDDGAGSGLAYWPSAPALFHFATRKVPGELVGSVDPGKFPIAGSASARDLVKLGNLLVVASDSGEIVAFDANGVTELEKLQPFAKLNRLSFNHRNLATDGHNRVFYTGLFGSIWAIKGFTLEDVRGASEDNCENLDNETWDDGIKCFSPVEGSVRLSYMLGSQVLTTPSTYLASGTFPSGNPSDFEVLTQDEIGKTFELETFYERYSQQGLGSLVADAEGIYEFGLTLKSSYQRAQLGETEASQPEGTPAPPAELRAQSCAPEEPRHDRYQRVTVDNLTTGQTWSVDIENPWPVDEEGDGTGRVEKIRARKGDLLRVRYNLRSLGYVSLAGAGIQVVDLNRFYRLSQPRQTPGGAQCGRRLGRFEGATIDWPECVDEFGMAPEGISLTPSVAVHSETGCEQDACRGTGRIDVYSPLQRVGGIHSASTADDPGALYFFEMAACMRTVDEKPVFLRDLALANEAEWIERGVTGDVSGTFIEPPEDFEPYLRQGDLAFLSLGVAGIFVFDVTDRELSDATLVGLLQVPGHTAFRLQVDQRRGILLAGGTDSNQPGNPPIIDVWDLRNVAGGPGTQIRPQPRLTVNAPWSTNHLGIDTTGTGIVYSWDVTDGPLALPIDRAEFKFSGLYLPDEELYDDPPEGQRKPSIQRITSTFVPLGVPMETDLERELDPKKREENEREGTAAFKVRLSLPGDFGETLTAKVQSLRALPDERHLGRENVGAMVAMPGGPGWPETEVKVTLRRVGKGLEEGSADEHTQSEGGRLGIGYNLYESVETIVLLADPRARRKYQRQDFDDSAPGGKKFDEKAQCRRCDYPSYLPDPNDPGTPEQDFENVKEMLAGGRYLRAFLWVDNEAAGSTQRDTTEAIAYFVEQDLNYPLPAGWAGVAAPADAVPSPLQASLAEPAQNPAFWSPNEAGVSVMLAGGDLMVKTTDHQTTGRGVPFTFERTYRSQMLGYGALGATGWVANLQAHLRENSVTGEVEYHDGHGQVWRFFPRGDDDETKPNKEDYEDDSSGAYWAPKGVYLRLQKLSGDQGWRLLGRTHDVMQFDRFGRLTTLSDRLRQNSDPRDQGNSLELRYDAYGQLVELIDDLGRSYRFEYFDDPRPENEGGDGERYGLLEKIEDFVERTVEYEWGQDRELLKVKLPEVKNPVEAYAEYSYEGEERPKLEYEYAPQSGVDPGETNRTAILHGDFAKLRLEAFYLPQFLPSGSRVPRVRFAYQQATGRLTSLSFPDRDNTNPENGGVRWRFDVLTPANTAAPVEELDVVAPWGHRLEHELEKGRITKVRENLAVVQANGTELFENVDQLYQYSEDGRLVAQTAGDGGQVVNCYPDGAGSEVLGGSEGCAEGEPTPLGQDGPQIDRMTLANVVRNIRRATTPEGHGSADYTQIVQGAEYSADNLMQQMTDGLQRKVGIPIGQAKATVMASFDAEGVGASFKYDDYGRVSEFAGFGDGAKLKTEFHEDRRGKKAAGLLKKISPGGDKFWRELEYDDADNIKEERTSYGALTRYTYDNWDRAVRIESGLSEGGALVPVGGSNCSGEKGAKEEKAYDAAGHVIRERLLQDYVRADGEVDCRWVEVIYTYNAREQVVSVEQTHLSSPLEPGEVMPQAVKTQEKVFDRYGRVEQEKNLNLVDPPLIKTYRYDEASRVVGASAGQSTEVRFGYDRKHRLIRQTDGDVDVWRGHYNVWDRLYHEVDATGLITRRQFDRAGNPVRETQWASDPTQDPQAKLLNDLEGEFTSFGQVSRSIEKHSADDGTGQPVLLVSERTFDGSGRTVGVFSGPPLAGSKVLDYSQARRTSENRYELETGRLMLALRGGLASEPAPLATRFEYLAESKASWPDRVVNLEQVPGQADLVETSSSTFVRDTLGRVVVSTGSDGSQVATLYNRTGGPIQVRTGAGTTMSTSFDSMGRTLRYFRPNSRGETSYSYDLDGRLRSEVISSEGGSWVTRHVYDSTGRRVRTDHPDNSFEAWQYNDDNTVAETTTRDGVVVAFTWDAANRLVSAVPTAGPQRSSLAPLDAGNFFSHDILSRPLSASRGGFRSAAVDPALTVQHLSYDMASRPNQEIVGNRASMSWRYDLWSKRVELTLPAGVARSEGAFLGYSRSYDTLGHLVDIAARGGEPAAATLGATWGWSGNHLYSMATKATVKTVQRIGYIDGAGPQAPGFDGDQPAARWNLGTLTWGADDRSTAIDAMPNVVWGQMAYGWRGNDGTPQDGLKIGRLAVAGPELDLFAGMGWSWNYDAGARLSQASSGRGDLQGRSLPASDEAYRYEYGKGDELEKIVREFEGRISNLSVGPHGRITHRDSVPFHYDPTGRRTEDDRFVYLWNWRGELVSVTVKREWAGASPTVSPYADHQIRYEYDGVGRLTYRWHLGPLPENVLDETQRPFIEKRTYVWEVQGLVAEVGYGDAEETQIRWRKTYLPGPSGYDDALQVVVDNVAFPGGAHGGQRLYTYLRDELGTVIGLVAEQEGSSAEPSIPVRYLYTPYGEAHAELGPELRRIQFEAGIFELAGVSQPPISSTLAQGAMRLVFTLPVTPSSLASGITLEMLTGSGWVQVDPGTYTLQGDSLEPADVLLLPNGGWKRGVSYRVNVSSSLRDGQGRSLVGPSRSFELQVPQQNQVAPAFEQRLPLSFESYEAAGGNLEGRFPGGQNHLFQGLWTDPVTGIAYARARWYDGRNATWLSEDPMLGVDSPNRYAFVGWQPQMGTDPSGKVVNNVVGGLVSVAIGYGASKLCESMADDEQSKAQCAYTAVDAAVDFGLGFATSGLSAVSKIKTLGKVGAAVARPAAEIALDTAAEVVRKEAKGEDYTLEDLARGAAKNWLIGEAGARIGKKIFAKYGRNADPGQVEKQIAENANRTVGGNGAQVSEAAEAAVVGLRPSNFGLQTIAEIPELHRLWNQARRELSKPGSNNAVTRYLEKFESGARITQKEAEAAYAAVQRSFAKKLKGTSWEGQVGELHHWNYPKGDFPLQVLDPRNLVPTGSRETSRELHERIHRATSSSPTDFWASRIAPEHEMPIDISFEPLP